MYLLFDINYRVDIAIISVPWNSNKRFLPRVSMANFTRVTSLICLCRFWSTLRPINPERNQRIPSGWNFWKIRLLHPMLFLLLTFSRSDISIRRNQKRLSNGLVADFFGIRGVRSHWRNVSFYSGARLFELTIIFHISLLIGLSNRFTRYRYG